MLSNQHDTLLYLLLGVSLIAIVYFKTNFTQALSKAVFGLGHNQILSSKNLFKYVTLLALLLLSYRAQAETLSEEIFSLSEVIQIYEQKTFRLYENITEFATTVLYYFAGFSIFIAGFNHLFRHNGTIEDVIFVLIRIILIVGLFQFFIKYGYGIASDIINSLISLSHTNNFQEDHLLQIFNNFFSLVEDFAKAISTQNAAFFIVFLSIAYCMIALLVIHYAVTYICAIFISITGVIVMGLGALNITRAYALNFFKLVFATGLKLFALSFIFNIGQEVLLYMITQMQLAVEQGQIVHIQDAAFILLIMFFILVLSYRLPNLLSSLIFTPAIENAPRFFYNINRL